LGFKLHDEYSWRFLAALAVLLTLGVDTGPGVFAGTRGRVQGSWAGSRRRAQGTRFRTKLVRYFCKES